MAIDCKVWGSIEASNINGENGKKSELLLQAPPFSVAVNKVVQKKSKLRFEHVTKSLFLPLILAIFS